MRPIHGESPYGQAHTHTHSLSISLVAYNTVQYNTQTHTHARTDNCKVYSPVGRWCRPTGLRAWVFQVAQFSSRPTLQS